MQITGVLTINRPSTVARTHIRALSEQRATPACRSRAASRRGSHAGTQPGSARTKAAHWIAAHVATCPPHHARSLVRRAQHGRWRPAADAATQQCKCTHICVSLTFLSKIWAGNAVILLLYNQLQRRMITRTTEHTRARACVHR